MEKFVRIQSTKTIMVTAGLQYEDVTNPDAHIPDRLKVSPLWPKTTMLIREGVGNYPAEIVEWNTVKALIRDNVITIGGYVDSVDSTDVVKAEELKVNMEEVKAVETIEEPKPTKRQTKKLEELA